MAFFFPVVFQHAGKILLGVHLVTDVCLKERDERWYLHQSLSKHIKSTVCFVPCLCVDSQLLRGVAGVAEVVPVPAVTHPAPPELPSLAAILVLQCVVCS